MKLPEHIESKAPLLINPDLLKPLPEDLQGHACASCDKTQAMWVMAVPQDDGSADTDQLYLICSQCFLYESNWGKRRAADIELLIQDVEEHQKRVFGRDPKGRLAFSRDADKILASVALFSKTFSHTLRAHAIRERLWGEG